jgi:protease-4
LFALLLIFVGALGGKERPLPGRHTALVELSGVIAADSEASADRIKSGLQDAFKDKNTAGVILRVNSPGGSPVQANQINQEIRRLRGLHPKIPLYAVVDEICASGGYYVAAAADKIYVDQASIVGSIGVLMDGFGFTGTMEKLGVERRLMTAGQNKGFLDPFSPLAQEQRDYAQKLLEEIHQQFITVVRQGRGKRLREVPELYSGLIWSGAKSIELGLADELGSVDYVAREVIKAEDIVDFTTKESIAERFARRFGASLAESFVRLTAGPRLY